MRGARRDHGVPAVGTGDRAGAAGSGSRSGSQGGAYETSAEGLPAGAGTSSDDDRHGPPHGSALSVGRTRSSGHAPLPRDVPKQGLAHSLRAFHHRDFTLFWSGALISNTGSWLQNVTVPYVLYELTHNAVWVGLATFAQFLPGVLFGPAGGSMADRFDRRRLLLLTQSLMALAALLMWATWTTGARSPAAILGLVAVSGTLTGLNSPSWQAFVPALVPKADLLSAVTLNSLQFNAARALGPTAAGIVLATMGPGAAFLLNALSFGCVLAALVLMRQRDTMERARAVERGVVRQFTRALRYVRSQPGIEISILVAALVAFLGNPVTQFTVVYTQDVYHVGKVAFGVLSAAMGIGAALAAPLISGWDAVLRRATIVRWVLPAYGLSCALFGISSSFTLGFLGLFLAGAGFLAVISASNTAVQVLVADEFRGRVMAARVMSFTLAYSFGGLLEGWLAHQVGPRPTVTGAGLLLCMAGVVLATRPGRLDRLDDLPDVS